MATRLTFKQIVSSLPVEKHKSDSLWAKILLRRVSFYVAWIAIKLGISAFTVSMISLVLPLAAFVLFMNLKPLEAIILLNLWLLLDCADGNVARATGGSKMGDFVDSSSGYIMIGFSFFGLGLYLDLSATVFMGLKTPWFIIIGATTSILGLMARLYYQKFKNIAAKGNAGLKTDIVHQNSLLKVVDHNIGIGGFFTPILLIAYYLELLAAILILYALYTSLYFMGSSIILLKRSYPKMEN